MLDSDDYIYLDHNATTPICPEAVEEIKKVLHLHGNPSSSHNVGLKAKEALKGYRKLVGDAFGVDEEFVVFMSGGTEINNTVIRMSVENYWKQLNKKPYVVTSEMEHPSILNPLKHLEEQNKISIHYLPIKKEFGVVDYETLSEDILSESCLITVMYANNETGVVQPVNQMFEFYKMKTNNLRNGLQPVFHSDASQVIGRIPLQKPYNFDVITVTGHKFGGPAIAAMISTNSNIQSMLLEHPLVYGGGQEGGKRSGTENLPMIAGLSVAIDSAIRNVSSFDEVEKIRDYLETQLLKKLSAKSFYLRSERLPNTASITFSNMKMTAGELLEKCRNTFAASTGAACHADTIIVSPCLLALGRSPEEAVRTVRFSLGRENTKDQIDKVITTLESVLYHS